MKLRNIFIFAFLALIFIAGCGGNSSGPTPPQVNVSFSQPPPNSMDTGASLSIAAIVSNDSSNGGVTWSLSCSNSQCGTLSATSSASSAAITYKAPASVPGSGDVVLTATAVADTSVSASATIQIQAPSAPITVSLNPAPPATLPAGQSTPLTAVVSNDSSDAGVTWTVKCGSSSCGSFIPGSTASATATTFLAPGAVPTPATVTVTATSIADSTKSASASITITQPTPVLANGSYVFHVAGSDTDGFYCVAGTITVENGAISGGEQDAMDGTSANSSISATNSSITREGGNVQIVLNTQNQNLGVNGIETFRGSVVSANRILISEFDASATATGSLDQQIGIAMPAGSYAFTVGGVDGVNSSVEMGMGGVLHFVNGALLTADSTFDFNDGANVIGQGRAFSSGSVSAPDQYGRVIVKLVPASSAQLSASTFVGYVLGPDRLELVEQSGDALQAILGGEALGQGSNTNTFNSNSVIGQSYAFGANGEDINGIAVFAGAFSFNANGTVGGVVTINDFVNNGAMQISGGQYSVNPNGRVTISNVTFSNSDAVMDFQLYLDGDNNALELGVDTIQVSFGSAFAQVASSATYAGNFAISAQGFGGIENAPLWSGVGPLNIANGVLTGYADYSVQNSENSASILTPSIPLFGGQDSTRGLISISGLDASSPSVTDTYGYYPIDDQRLLAIEVDNNQIGLMFLEQVQTGQ